jgi:hypothetical protein
MVLALYYLRQLFTRPKDSLNTILSGALLLGGFIALTACQILPSAQFIALSNRWDWGYSQIMTDYLTPNRLKHFFNPDFLGNPFNIGYTGKWGYHETVNYIGLVPLVLFLAGVLWFGRARLYGWFFSVAALFIVLSLGDSTPVSKAVFRFFFDTLPGFSHNRSIGRMMVMPSFAMACAAGLVFDAWMRREKQPAGNARFFSRSWRWLPAAALVLTVVDLWLYGARFVGTRTPPSKSDILPGAALEEVLKDPSYPRVAQSVDANANLLYRVRGLFSTDRTNLSDMEDYLGVIGGAYNTPLADISRLKYLYSKTQGPTDRWENMAPNIFRNRMVTPPAFLAGGYEILPGDNSQAFRKIRGGMVDVLSTVLLPEKPKGLFDSQPGSAGTARITFFGNNRIEVDCQAERPCLLFLAEQHYPGWKAEVDGKSVPVLRANGLFRAVPLAKAGSHKVVLVYRPWLLYLGAAVSAAAWLLLILLGWKKRHWMLDVKTNGRLVTLVRAVFWLGPLKTRRPLDRLGALSKVEGEKHEEDEGKPKNDMKGKDDIQYLPSGYGAGSLSKNRAIDSARLKAQLGGLAVKITGRFVALLRAVFGMERKK